MFPFARHITPLLLLCLLLCTRAARTAPRPPVSFLSIEQGLSNNTVRSIFQDHNGFIWLGTFDGLNRYDGYDCKVFRNIPNDSHSLVHNIILSITEDSLHNIWIGTRQGVSRLDPLFGRFTTIRLAGNRPLNSVVKDIRADRHNNIYIGTEGTGLLVCAPGALTAQTIPLRRGDTSITQYGVKVIRQDAAGNIWVLVQKYGIARYDARKRQLILVNESIPGMAWIETQGNTLIAADGYALYYYDQAANVLNRMVDYREQYFAAGSIVSFSVDPQGACWIGTVQGNLLTWKPGTAQAVNIDSTDPTWSFNAVGLHTVYVDRQSRKWVGTARGGAAIIDPHKSRFETVAHEPGNNNSLVDNDVSALYEAGDGKLYIGTDGAGLSVWDRTTNQFTTLRSRSNDGRSLPDNSITSIVGDHSGQIWITTFRQGIVRLNSRTLQVERYMPDNPATETPDRVTYALFEDRKNGLWVSTLRQNSIYGALYRFDPAKNKFKLFDGGLSDLFSLYEDRQGQMWGGNLNQLVQIDRVSKKHTFYNIGHAVRKVYEDRNGHLWIGTEGGGLQLFDRIKKQVTARYTVNEGLCNDAVLTMLEDNNGQLWISTFNGLSCFDPQKRQFKNYYQSDGLQSNQFHYNSALALRSGEFVFGGIKGITVFHPAAIRADHTMPPLQLTGCMVNNKPVEQDSSYIKEVAGGEITAITVPYSQAVLQFRFTALELSVPGKIRYAYYMEGWDRGWNQSGNIRTAAYTHLSEGNYTFRVKSTNGEGEWNPQELAMRITVLPPWYRSWWAYTLYAICLLGALYLFMNYRIRQNRLQYEIKVAQLQAREAQLNAQKEKEVHEKRLTFFTNISHEFRTPLTLIIDPVKEMMETEKEPPQKEGLNMVYRNARRLLSLVDQLLLFRKAETQADSLRLTMLNAPDICREVFYSFVQQARIKKIDYVLKGAEGDMELCADRGKLEIILFNLLSNAIKFTPPGGSISMQVERHHDTIEIQVADTGPGIPPGTGDKLFNRFYQVKENQSPAKTGFGIGLYLVKHFTELHHGNIRYESKPGKGTIFKLELLQGTAHFAGQEIFNDAPPAPIEQEPALIDTSVQADKGKELTALVTEIPTILIVDDDEDLRKYLLQVFSKDFNILQAMNGREGVNLAQQYLPDLIISDITMEELGGLDLCRQVKQDQALSHIPVILLTASTASETRLQGIQSGADDYVTKPFEKELLKARVVSLLKKRNSLQQYFYNEITLQKNDGKVSVEYREFLEKCIRIVEDHLDDETFSIKTLTAEMGMSRSSLYRKVNSVSGQSIVSFIRFIRLRKAARLMIDTENNINEIASITGFNDIKYFRAHFAQLFGMNPSEYIRRFRKPFHNNLHLNKNIIKPDDAGPAQGSE